MKVLIILTTTFDISGISQSVMNYYRYMDKSDMSIDFVAPNVVNKRLKDEINSARGEVYELPFRVKNPLKYSYKLFNIIKNNKYDIVHAHGNSATLFVEMFAAKLAGVKVRISHSRNTETEHVFINKILNPLFQKSYTHGFACGLDAGKWLFGKNFFKVITNGNDIEKFSFDLENRKEIRDKYNLLDKKVIGHVGHFNYQKNHEYLIKVFKELHDLNSNYVLMLVGRGKLLDSIKKNIKDNNLEDSVIIVGKTLEVEKFLHSMDMLIFPSRFEGLPNAIIESQIAGLPSLISESITSEVVITDLVDFLPIDIDPKRWAERILEMKYQDRLANKYKYEKDVTDAGFNVKENAKELKTIYKDLL